MSYLENFLENFYFYTILVGLFSYFIVSIIYRDFVYTLNFMQWYRYYGVRAVLLASAFLLVMLFALLVVVAGDDFKGGFNMVIMLVYGFMIGLPIVWLVRRLLINLVDLDQNELIVSTIPQNLAPRSVTLKRFLFWFIAGFPLGFF